MLGQALAIDHTQLRELIGEAELREGDWYGTTVNRGARLRATAHAAADMINRGVVAYSSTV